MIKSDFVQLNYTAPTSLITWQSSLPSPFVEGGQPRQNVEVCWGLHSAAQTALRFLWVRILPPLYPEQQWYQMMHVVKLSNSVDKSYEQVPTSSIPLKTIPVNATGVPTYTTKANRALS